MPLKEKDEIKAAINEEIWSIYDSNTTCRQLAFAEGGICWFFNSPACQFSTDVIFILASATYWFVAKYYECRNGQIKKSDSKFTPIKTLSG